jgi:hypothetical protein
VSRWEPVSAFPIELMSALFRRKKKATENDYQEVKELLESHHPVDHIETSRKLSIKIRIVILLLALGVAILIADMLKKETYKLIYGRYPKPADSKSTD